MWYCAKPLYTPYGIIARFRCAGISGNFMSMPPSSIQVRVDDIGGNLTSRNVFPTV
jgi:hypothetical protein